MTGRELHALEDEMAVRFGLQRPPPYDAAWRTRDFYDALAAEVAQKDEAADARRP